MNSAYEILSNIRGFIKNADALSTIAPRRDDPERHEVHTAYNRGGFKHYVYVPTGDDGKARLLINFMDTKVSDNVNDRFGWSFQCVADFDGTRFVYVNPVFEALLSRQLYERLVEVGVCQSGANLRHLVKIDLSHLPVFPYYIPDVNYVNDKCELLRLKEYYKNLKNLQNAARKWFKDNDMTQFRGFEPIQTRAPKKEDTVAILVPYYRYSVDFDGELEPIAFDKSEFRKESWQGKRLRVEYTPELYRKLCAKVLVTKRKIDSLAQSVRVRELSYLEHQPFDSVIKIGDKRFVKNITTDYEVYYVKASEAEEYLKRNPNAKLKTAEGVTASAIKE